MPLWLYELPNWLFGSLIIVFWIVVGVGGHQLLHRLFKPNFDEADKGLALALLGVVATINSLLLAFSAVSVWDAYNTADKAVSGEASTVAQLSTDLAVFNSTASRSARVELQFYVQTVVSEEWPAMRDEQGSSEAAWEQINGLFRVIGQLEPNTPREAALMPEIWARTNELMKYRRERLDAADGRVPGTLWSVVLIGTLLSLAPTFVMSRSRFNVVAIGMLSLSMGLVFFFIAAMDRPFAGTESIGVEPFKRSLETMGRWDLSPQ